MNTVLIVAPHPDDETLGCGGTILKHKELNDTVFWLVMTRMSKEEGFNFLRIKERDQEINAVGRAYQFKESFNLGFSTTKLDIISQAIIIRDVNKIIYRIKPQIVYLPFKNDIHSDHKITFETSFSALKNFRHPYVKKILAYEVLSETDFALPFDGIQFIPNYFSDITKFLNKKIDIMKKYKSEIRKHPFPRSIENIKALAFFRGATAGVKAAEAFILLKEVN